MIEERLQIDDCLAPSKENETWNVFLKIPS